MERKELIERIIEEFGCDHSEAQIVAERAITLKRRIESDPESWDGSDINLEYIISRLDMAPGRISVTGKWNWWAGAMNYFGGTPGDYRIE